MTATNVLYVLSFISISVLYVFQTDVFVCFGVLLCALRIYGLHVMIMTNNKANRYTTARSIADTIIRFFITSPRAMQYNQREHTVFVATLTNTKKAF